MPAYYPTLPPLDLAELKRYAGLKNAEFDDKLLEEAAAEAAALAKPKTFYEIYGYDTANAVIAAPLPFRLDGRSVVRHLKGASKICVFAATVGGAAENAVSAYFKEGRYAYSLLLDAAATCAVELAADQLEKEISRLAAKDGLQLRRRFSPGYGDWDLKSQPRLVELANAAAVGVSLTESLMLEPRKSITAVIGLAAKNAVETDCGETAANAHDCAACDKTDCPMRSIYSKIT